MIEGKSEDRTKPHNTSTEELGTVPSHAMGLRLPTIMVMGELSNRLRTSDVASLENTLPQDAASLASQLGEKHYKHAMQMLLSTPLQQLWSEGDALTKLTKPFVGDRVPARLVPHTSLDTREAIREAGKVIENNLKENLRNNEIVSQTDERYMRTRDYYRNLMYAVKKSCRADEREIRKAIFLARASGNTSDYENVLSDISKATPSHYKVVTEGIYERNPNLAPHKETLEKLFSYLNQGELNPPALPDVAAAFTTLPNKTQSAVAKEFRAWFVAQEMFFAFYDGCIHKNEVLGIKELEQVLVSTAKLSQFPDCFVSLGRYLLLNVLRHDTSKDFAQTAAALRKLNDSPWYRQYNEWLSSLPSSSESFTDLTALLDEKAESTQSGSAPKEGFFTSQKPEIEEFGGAGTIATEELRSALSKAWLSHLREIWVKQRDGTLPSEDEIRKSPLFALYAKGDAAREKMWVDTLRWRYR
jgi:hypothetical protein